VTNDKQLSPHFTLFDLTRTDHADLQAENRHVTSEEEKKLAELANLLETCKIIVGCDLEIHSGRRYLELNKRVGGSERSQHMKCEAADFSPLGPDTEESVVNAWQKLAKAARAPGSTFKFGQLIVENAAGRDGGRKYWIHVSLGAPYRDKARCGEILTMKDGKFTMISKVS
jgi:zinc D-Ala-D-Ala carboxypeptidase